MVFTEFQSLIKFFSSFMQQDFKNYGIMINIPFEHTKQALEFGDIRRKFGFDFMESNNQQYKTSFVLIKF